jgi:hypothetical protein
MKKRIERKDPSRASLRAVPPVDFERHEPGRRNPFAARIRREGWSLVHEGPSRASLREIPELGARAKGQPNPYARRIRAAGFELQIGRRRPRRGKEVGRTQVRSVRLPPAVWARIRYGKGW